MKRSQSRRPTPGLIILVSLVLVACGPAQLPDGSRVDVEGTTALPTNAPPPVATITTEQALEKAQAELRSFFRIWHRELGLKYPQDADQVTISSPYQIFQLDPETLKRYVPGTPIAPLLTPEGQWLVPVLYKGQPHSGMQIAGLEAGAPSVGVGQPPEKSRNLVTVHNRYAGQAVDLKLVTISHVVYLMLLTEDTKESLVILYAPPQVRQEWLQPVPPEQLIPALVEAAFK